MIVDVAVGWSHTCAVTSTGSILTWGYGIATGHGEGTTVLNPSLLQDLSSKGVISVSASYYHTVCITKAGEVFSWGGGDYGKLGHDGDETNQEIPKRVEALVDVKATMASCGRHHHTAVCTENCHVYTCGYGGFGQLGHGDKDNLSSPVLIQDLEGKKNITQVQCARCYNTMALTSSGYVLTWDYAENGRLGHGHVKPESLTIPYLLEGLREHNVVHIASGYSSCAVLVVDPAPSIIR